MKFLICVFATQDTPYITIAENQIIQSLKELNIDYSFSKVTNLGSWRKNTSYKSKFALDMLNSNPNKNIVLLDADCRVLKYPELFDNIPEYYNIGAHVLDWNSWYCNGSDKHELLSGTLFLRNTARTKQIVEYWANACIASPDTWEQLLLQNTITYFSEHIYELPIEYCYINKLPDGQDPYVKVTDPVIVHYQASRELKRFIQ